MRNFDYIKYLGLTDLYRYCSAAEENQVSNPDICANSSAYYWTGTRAPSQYHAYFMSFSKTYNGGKPYIEGAESQNSASGLRWKGFKIRPVLNK